MADRSSLCGRVESVDGLDAIGFLALYLKE
jgi:hypothetical protein